MNNGEILAVKPAPAPPAIRRRFPWVRGPRFFDVFFPRGEEPILVTAFDRSGQVIGRSKRRGGLLFYAP